jgi:hypothetical protein
VCDRHPAVVVGELEVKTRRQLDPPLEPPDEATKQWLEVWEWFWIEAEEIIDAGAQVVS